MNREEKIVLSYPIGLAAQKEVKYLLSFGESRIFLKPMDKDEYVAIRFYQLARLMLEEKLEYVFDSEANNSCFTKSAYKLEELLDVMQDHMGAVYSIHDDRVYCFTKSGTILSDCEEIFEGELPCGSYIVHPQIEAFNLMEEEL